VTTVQAQGTVAASATCPAANPYVIGGGGTAYNASATPERTSGVGAWLRTSSHGHARAEMPLSGAQMALIYLRDRGAGFASRTCSWAHRTY
jgi:hypothetical protein